MSASPVAQTIYEQLGGRRFAAMTGARDFVSDGNTLRFRLPARFARRGITRVRIDYHPGQDLYEIQFARIRGLYTLDVIERAAGVYAEDLQRIFTDATGLDTHL